MFEPLIFSIKKKKRKKKEKRKISDLQIKLLRFTNLTTS